MDWFDLLAVQGILKSLLQHHNCKATILWLSSFFMIQFSYPYMTIGKIIALTTQTFIGKVVSLFFFLICLFFNTLSRFVIPCLPRSKRLLISWLQSLSAVILEPKKIKSVTVFPFSLLFATKWWDQMPWSWFFSCWVSSQLFTLLFHFSSRGSLVPLHFLPLVWYHLHTWSSWYFSLKSWFQFFTHPA